MNKPEKRVIAGKAPAVEKAVSFLCLMIDNGTWQQGARLPTYLMLAKQADVSGKTMLKALGTLANKKLLTVKKNVGFYVGDSLPQKQDGPGVLKNPPKWAQIKDRLLKDILGGEFSTMGTLPPLKELLVRYGTGYLTVQKAIAHLVQEKLLERYRQGYRIEQFSTERSTNTITLVVNERAFVNELWSSNRLYIDQLLQGLEKECNQKNINLVKYILGGPPVGFKNTLGFIILHFPEMNTSLNQTLATILAENKPVVIINQIEDVGKEANLFLTELSAKKKHLFVSDQTRFLNAGFKTGRFLFQKGHQKICCFEASPGPRLHAEDLTAGLIKAYSSVGIANAVNSIRLYDFSGSMTESFLTANDRTIKRSVQPLSRFLDTTTTKINRMLAEPYKKGLILQVQQYKFKMNYRTFMAPLFRKALTIPNITAWVFFNDEGAIHGGMEFLASENINVPDRIAIIGNGDDPESKLHDLTTYHYDYAGAARKMLNLILYPEYARKSLCLKGTNIFEVDGMVIERGSA